MSSNYNTPPVHTVSAEEQEYLKSLDPRELSLHNIAVKKLGSSYFVWKSHGFQLWKEKNKNNISNK